MESDPATLASAAAMVGPVIAPTVDSILQRFGSKIYEYMGGKSKSVADKAVVSLRLGFKNYLNTSYNRCQYFKTILNQSQPLLVTEYYVHNTLSGGSYSEIDDDDLIAKIDDLKHIVIMGLAGSGKSMFMKYMTIAKFNDQSGRIPLFVELRNLNSLTQRDLIEYIRASCSSRDASISAEQFRIALSSGAFTLILDGFDEINHEFLNEISKQILHISKNYPDINIIVSSRHDDRFNGWPTFHTFGVNKLSKAQCIQLIQSLDHNAGVKRRFIREVKSRLYDSHESFLSSPLLTTIMLLNYEEFAEIPAKMHSFYSQAFDTLYQKHDASKEQYQRKILTGLTREDFKSTFAAFCALSYLEEVFSFDAKELHEKASAAVKYIGQARTDIPKLLKPDDFITDLKEAVCLLQQDGLEFAFVHRSFQEYFAALFATSLHGDKFTRILDKYALRFGDSVISMTMGMARETVEYEWVLPTIDRLTEVFKLNDRGVSTGERYSAAFEGLIIYRFNNILHPGLRSIKMDSMGPLEALCALYPNELGRGLIMDAFNKTAIDAIAKSLEGKSTRLPSYAKLQRLLKEPVKPESDEGNVARNTTFIEMDRNQDWWLEYIGADETFVKIKRGFSAIKRDINGRSKKRQTILEEFL